MNDSQKNQDLTSGSRPSRGYVRRAPFSSDPTPRQPQPVRPQPVATTRMQHMSALPRAAVRRTRHDIDHILANIDAYFAKRKKPVNKLTRLMHEHKVKTRIIAFGGAFLIVFTLFPGLYQAYFMRPAKYDISPRAQLLLGKEVPQFATKISYSAKAQEYVYNDGYSPSTGESTSAGQTFSPKFIAHFNSDPQKGMQVEDAASGAGITFVPQFGLASPKPQSNRLVYPLRGIDGQKVVTLKAANTKEDIILNRFTKDNLDFKYKLQLTPGLEARMESDGSVGVYGVEQALLGNVATGNDNDKKLLDAARKNGEKRNLVFRIPAPFIVNSDKKITDARAYYSLQKDILTIKTVRLSKAHFPISIDPSVYIETAAKLMRGNNESNIDFDTDNELIQKGQTTGGRFNNWINTLSLNDNRWNAGTAVAGGYIYSVGGAKSDTSMYMTPGTTTYVVPAGVTSITVKSWGAGGGGGGASADRAGGAGGGGGYAAATLSVTPGEVLNLYVGGGGKGGRYTAPDVAGDGGGGGGYSGIFRSSTPLIVAGGGGGGGGANGDSSNNGRAAGSAGGAGGGTTAVAGSGNGSTTGGGAGTPSAGGSAGASTTSGGSAGGSLSGGQGASLANAFRSTGGSNGGGNGGNGNTGATSSLIRPGGGGGGGGYFGGGGGGSANADLNGGGGGGGGSSYTTGTSTTNTAGSGTTPGNSGDSDRNSVADGGAGGSATNGPNNGSDGENGIVLVTVSGANAVATGNVYWAKFNTSSYAINATDPGNGTCTNWCTNSAYDLPSSATLSGLSLVAYNGYLYALGGQNSSGTRQNTVYIAKLGANGEPQLWHPTDTNKNNWVYWYSSSNTLSSATTYMSAVAYNNRLYRFGGETSGTVTTATGTTTVEYADIKPTGDIGAWTSTGMVALTSNRHHHTTLVYNDRIYMIGGLSGTASTANLLSSVQYIKLASDGTMSGSWVTTNAFSTARMSWGGTFATIWGGFIYLAGGCTAVTSGYCSTVASDVQLNSINADGSVADWNTILNVTNQRTGMGLVAWRNGLYLIGGCKNQNTSTGVCTWGSEGNDYASINDDGDASTVSNSVASGTAPCSGGSPTDCNTPPEGSGSGQGGNMSGGAIINNGIIYYIGGCTAVGNGSICYTGNSGKASPNTFYASIASDGTISKVSSCTGTGLTFVDSWCVDSNHALTTGLAGIAVTVFNNVIYAIGGTTGADWQSNLYYNVLNSDGSLSAWTSQSFSSVALGSARGYAYAFTRANPSSAGTYPGNLYVLGGCAGTLVSDNGVDCSGVQYSDVYKCKILTSGAIESAVGNQCTTSGQLQIDSEPGTGGTQGLGVMAGTLYANYIYLVGGQSPNEAARGEVMYAKIDNSNNIVAVSGGIWQTSANQLSPARRRGVAFGYNGYLYGLTGYNSGETLNDLLFAKINVSDGSIGAFTQSAVTVLPRWDSQAIVNNGYVYTLGGCSSGVPPQNCVTMTRTVQTFQLYNNYSGAPASYGASANLFTTDRMGATSAVYNGYMYIAGGCTGTTECSAGTYLSNVQKSAIAGDGSLGAWSNTTAVLPAQRAWGKLEVAGGTLYYIGGQDNSGTASATVYYGTPASGDISTWSTATNGLPGARTKMGTAVWNNRLYTMGGKDGSGTVSTTVYVSPSLASGGDITSAWTSTTGINVARYGTIAISYANNLYIFGGNDGTNYLSDAQFASIGYKTGTISQSGTTVTGSGTSWSSGQVGSKLLYSDGSTAIITAFSSSTSITVDVSKTVSAGSLYTIQDGTVGAWSYTTSLPGPLSEGDGFAVNGYMYLIGGRSAATTCDSNTIVAPISANTTIATGNNPTGLGQWFETNQRYSGNRYGAAVSYNEGKAYILGGMCNATFTGTNRVSQTTLLSQPQIAKYSRAIDTDTDVFPTKWLMNGLDNSTGAEWYMKYRSMHDLDTLTNPNEDCGTTATMAQMTTWGYETNYGQVSLGTPATYTPRNGTSTSAGTITQSGTTVTGSGTSFSSDLIGGLLIYADGTSTTISSVASTTSMTVATSRTIGSGQSYTAAGGNINCARYYYFSVTIDSQQAYGYPEDVTRGPTIADLSLFFTSDPSKRMRHGKTFTGGQQQPLDTPF